MSQITMHRNVTESETKNQKKENTYAKAIETLTKICCAMYLNNDGDIFLANYKTDFENFKRLIEFFKKFESLPLVEDKR